MNPSGREEQCVRQLKLPFPTDFDSSFRYITPHIEDLKVPKHPPRE
jgi:hypothetical protein